MACCTVRRGSLGAGDLAGGEHCIMWLRSLEVPEPGLQLYHLCFPKPSTPSLPALVDMEM